MEFLWQNFDWQTKQIKKQEVVNWFANKKNYEDFHLKNQKIELHKKYLLDDEWHLLKCNPGNRFDNFPNEVRKMPKSVYYQVSWKIGREEK